MKKLLLLPLVCGFCGALLTAQMTVYDDNTTLIDNTWAAHGTLTEVSSNTPHSGNQHYEFSYGYTSFWSGVGLNMDNWGNGTGEDFSGFTHLRIAYRGMSGAQGLEISLNSPAGQGNTISGFGPTVNYTVMEIPLLSFQAGNSLDLTNVGDIYLSVTGGESGTGTLYFDQVELFNQNTGVTTSLTTWERANSMNRGINLSNWLDAYWLIPFNAYPDTDKYNEQTIIDFRNLGVDAFRLPVTFERIASTSPPYTLDMSHPAIGLVDDAVQWAANQNVKLIIDMHHGYELTDANFQTELPRLEAIWEQLINRY
ncbi:MAG: cellulase family glycosylhydrolase, partial [Bacteroidota bacterium]